MTDPFDPNNDNDDNDAPGEGVHVMAFTDEDMDAARALVYTRLSAVYGPEEAKAKLDRVNPLAMALAYREAVLHAPEA